MLRSAWAIIAPSYGWATAVLTVASGVLPHDLATCAPGAPEADRALLPEVRLGLLFLTACCVMILGGPAGPGDVKCAASSCTMSTQSIQSTRWVLCSPSDFKSGLLRAVTWVVAARCLTPRATCGALHFTCASRPLPCICLPLLGCWCLPYALFGWGSSGGALKGAGEAWQRLRTIQHFEPALGVDTMSVHGHESPALSLAGALTAICWLEL